jgi:transcriptional regulator with XRE-family HTH domain
MSKIIDQILAQNLRILREDRGMTQECVARFIKKSKRMVNRYENARNSVPKETLLDYSQLYNIDIMDLFTGYDEGIKGATGDYQAVILHEAAISMYLKLINKILHKNINQTNKHVE